MGNRKEQCSFPFFKAESFAGQKSGCKIEIPKFRDDHLRRLVTTRPTMPVATGNRPRFDTFLGYLIRHHTYYVSLRHIRNLNKLAKYLTLKCCAATFEG